MKIGLIVLLMGLSSWSFAESTLQNVRKAGVVRCGVNQGLAGFSVPDSKGAWKGIDVDFCRALAAAIFGDDAKVKYIPLSGQQRFTALQSGEIDVLSRNTTMTLSRDTALGLNFGPALFYDGQGFMVRKSDGIKTAKDLDGASICLQQGTTTELNLSDYFRTHNLKFKPVVFEDVTEVTKAFLSKRCDVLTADASALAAERSKVSNPDSYFILPEIISKEPLGPAVRHGDDSWADIVRWTLFALVTAEELGIDSKNIDSFANSESPQVKRFMGKNTGNGKALGLDERWSYWIVKKVGNYAEVFERNVGMGSPLKIERGYNALWNKGGIMYAPPML